MCNPLNLYMVVHFNFILDPMSFLKSPITPKNRKENCDESSLKFLNQVLHIHLSYYVQNTGFDFFFPLRKERLFCKAVVHSYSHSFTAKVLTLNSNILCGSELCIKPLYLLLNKTNIFKTNQNKIETSLLFLLFK